MFRPCSGSCTKKLRQAWSDQLTSGVISPRRAGTALPDLSICSSRRQPKHQRLILLCDDRDYEVVASVTGQPVRRATDVPVAGGSGSETPSGRADGAPAA